MLLFSLGALLGYLAPFASAQGTAGPFQVNPCECVRCFTYTTVSLRTGIDFSTICVTQVPKACPVTQVYNVPDISIYPRYDQVNPPSIEFITLHIGDSGVIPGQVYGIPKELCEGFSVVAQLPATPTVA